MKSLSGLCLHKVCFGVFLMYCFGVIYGQEVSRADLEKQSVKYFEDADYQQACLGFEELLSIYPKEVSFNYYLGRCYSELNIQFEKSLELLKYCADKRYNSSVHFHLFKAYLKTYRLKEAELSLHTFVRNASRKEQKNYQADYWLQVLTQVKVSTRTVKAVELIAKEEFKHENLEASLAGLLEGKFIHKPAELMFLGDNKSNYRGVMYKPLDTRNNLLYIPVSTKKNKNGIDIYTVRSLSGGEYSEPQALDLINTKYDEKYPYFDQETNTLYFSSNRIGGMGGYDLYKSKYNPSSRTFESPEPLGFPINTPYDEFMYVPNHTNKSFVFTSNRSSTQSMFVAYHVKLDSTVEELSTSYTPEQLKEFSHINASESTGTIHSANANVGSEYELTLQQAMETQLICDSLQSELTQQGNRLRAEKDAKLRKTISTEISVIKKNLNSCQSKADTYFELAQKLRGEQKDVLQSQEKKTQKKNTKVYLKDQIGDIKVYAYKGKGSEDVKVETKVEASASNFNVLLKSPYTKENPIPFDFKLPQTLVYRIQLGVYGDKLAQDAFGGLTPISAVAIPPKNLTKYYVGTFNSVKAAKEALQTVREYGYADAFIVSFFEQKQIPIQMAREKEFAPTNL